MRAETVMKLRREIHTDLLENGPRRVLELSDGWLERVGRGDESALRMALHRLLVTGAIAQRGNVLHARGRVDPCSDTENHAECWPVCSCFGD